MLEAIFRGLFDQSGQIVIPVETFLLCIAVSLLLGLLFAVFYRYKSHYTRSFLLALALLPAVVCVVIMMVNGNIGAGVAVAGAFSLVRFRSAPGTAKEIGAIFIAMAIGLISGMGYLGYAALFTLLMGLAFVLFQQIGLGKTGARGKDRLLRITIPEDLNYTDVLEEPLRQYTVRHELTGVKTTNLGSLFRLTYEITLRSAAQEKELIDALRCRNGNLEIAVSRMSDGIGEQL